MQVRNITYESVDSVVDTLHEAFIDYPVMQFILGPDATDFQNRHKRLVRLFVMARVLSKDPLFGIGIPDDLDATATVSLPENESSSPELAAYREKTWAGFSSNTKARYDEYVVACSLFDEERPHHHLNMVGVRNRSKGNGLGRRLVEHVIELADEHPESQGVSLTTEVETNIPFYQRLGFRITGHAQVAPGFESWGFFREKRTGYQSGR